MQVSLSNQVPESMGSRNRNAVHGTLLKLGYNTRNVIIPTFPVRGTWPSSMFPVTKLQTARIWCDNIGATYLTPNLLFHGQVKHVDIDFHVVRGRVARKLLDVRLISRLQMSSPRHLLLRRWSTLETILTCTSYD